MIHDSYLAIIQKHIGFKLIIAYVNEKNSLAIEPINLQDVSKKGIVADFIKSGKTNQSMNFYQDMNKQIVAIYNMNDIDLLIAKKVSNLGEKLKNRQLQKAIINNLKVSIGKKISIVSKIGQDYIVNNGIFQNMGIVGVTLSVPPFYNRTEMLKYPSIMNIFDENYNDLLNVD
ncbi:MAG TPA: hypothetical protein PLE30_08135 [Candidatus Kapabacteria bacterium]|nr:hypothetical protein [Candidatus Kapabacteria bacterium]